LINCTLFILAVLAVFSWIAAPVLIARVTPMGDYAGDMLLTNKIRDEGVLLTGHYSRWGFNHPGPFWFYYNYLIERLFSWIHVSRFQLWMLGSVIANSLFIAFSSLAFS
jgi:hypothetical protein